MDPHRKAFYKYHASMMELGRPGRPCLYRWIANRCYVRQKRTSSASLLRYVLWTGKSPLRKLVHYRLTQKMYWKIKWITPGKMLMVDLELGKVLDDEKVKRAVYEGKSYYNWIIQNRLKLRLEPEQEWVESIFDEKTLIQRQNAYGYTSEDVKALLLPMAEKGYEAIGSMGDDTPQAILSKESRHLSNYFKQHFAQVSNPPIDPIRERLVMSLFTWALV